MYDARFSIPFVDHSPSEAKSSISDFLGPKVVNSKNLAICFRSEDVPSLDKMTYRSLGASMGRAGRCTTLLIVSTLVAGRASGPGATSQLFP